MPQSIDFEAERAAHADRNCEAGICATAYSPKRRRRVAQESLGWAKAHLRRAHHFKNIALDGGHAEPVIGRAFARPLAFAHPTDSCRHARACPGIHVFTVSRH